MGKFFDSKAFAAALQAEGESEWAKPNAGKTAVISECVFNVMLQTPGKLAVALSKAIDAAHDALEKRIADLEKRLLDAERKSALRYRGIWLQDEQYKPGDLVTDAGSMWHCWEVTRDRPGEGSKDWQLAVKKGKDAR